MIKQSVSIGLIAGILLAAGLLSAPTAGAECLYFRVGYSLQQCRLDNSSTAKDRSADNAPLEDPLLKDAPSLPLVRVVCECRYSLHGANPICDFDKSEEQAGLLPAQDVVTLCKMGDGLCASVCAKQTY
jgi:hypothetical protein